jgi:hypothetical protein
MLKSPLNSRLSADRLWWFATKCRTSPSGRADIQTIFDFVGHIAFKIVIHTCGIMIVLGLLDMLYVKWRYTENLKMTKQEVKDEHKESMFRRQKAKLKKCSFRWLAAE